MSKPKVYIVGGGGAYAAMFIKAGFDVVDKLDDADLVQFTGGEDVSPDLYGEDIHPKTFCNPRRDMEEERLFRYALDMGKYITGICRGGQFLNVMNGGKMYQHVDNHGIAGTHAALDIETGRTIQVTSTHHQMMRKGAEGMLVATAALSTCLESMCNGNIITGVGYPGDHDDTEVVYYPGSQSLCFQPHPEFFNVDECTNYYFELLNRFFNLESAYTG